MVVFIYGTIVVVVISINIFWRYSVSFSGNWYLMVGCYSKDGEDYYANASLNSSLAGSFAFALTVICPLSIAVCMQLTKARSSMSLFLGCSGPISYVHGFHIGIV